MTGKRWPKRESPKWEIRHNPRRKDFDHRGVSGKVIVRKEGDVGVCRIRFSDEFVDALGHKLPFGVSSTFPVFLRLLWVWEAGAYMVSASYFHLPSRVYDLWTVGEHLPEWAKVKWHDFDTEKANPKEDWERRSISRKGSRKTAKTKD